MPLFIDPTGQPTYGVGICARCSRKFPLAELHPDPNSPGLMVCDVDTDDFDPYRLAPRQTEDITLPFTRPDVSLALTRADLNAGFDLLTPALSGSMSSGGVASLDMSVLSGDVVVTEFVLERSIDGGGFSELAVVPALPGPGHTYLADYEDTPVFTTTVEYRVRARDEAGDESQDSNVVLLEPPTPPLSGNYFVIGTTGSAFHVSQDGVAFSLIASGIAFNQIMDILWQEPRQRWVAAGISAFGVSTDNTATAWINRTPGFWSTSSTVRLAYNPATDTLVACSDSGMLAYSLDGGDTWADSGVFNVYSAVAWDPVLALFGVPHGATAGGAGGLRPTYRSANGSVWVQNADVQSMGSSVAKSNGAGRIGAVGPNSGVGLGGGFWTTTDGSAWTNLGTTLVNANIRSMDSDGANWAMWGTIGGNNVFSRSPTGANGTWTNSTVSTTGLGGTTMHMAADPTRSRWWTVGRNRVYVSTDALGTAWTLVLTSAGSFNAVGVRPAP